MLTTTTTSPVRKIVCAAGQPQLRPAVITEGGQWFEGRNHGEAYDAMKMALGSDDSFVEDGFVTPDGHFVDRPTAERMSGVDPTSENLTGRHGDLCATR